MTEMFLGLLNGLNNFLYGNFLVMALIVVGTYFSIRTNFVQIRLLPEAIRVILEKKTNKKVFPLFKP